MESDSCRAIYGYSVLPTVRTRVFGEYPAQSGYPGQSSPCAGPIEHGTLVWGRRQDHVCWRPAESRLPPGGPSRDHPDVTRFPLAVGCDVREERACQRVDIQSVSRADNVLPGVPRAFAGKRGAHGGFDRTMSTAIRAVSAGLSVNACSRCRRPTGVLRGHTAELSPLCRDGVHVLPDS